MQVVTHPHKDSGTHCYFHSISIPQLVTDQTSSILLNVLKSDKIKKCKYEMHVLYYQEKNTVDDRGVSKLGYVLKRRRFMIGKTSVVDLSDGTTSVNPLILKSMRTRNKELLITGPDFNQEKAKKVGGFLSKKFWAANLLWGGSDTFIDNVLNTVRQIRSDLPVIPTPLQQHPHKVSTTSSSTKAKPSHSHLKNRFKKKADKVTMTTSCPLIACDDDNTTSVM